MGYVVITIVISSLFIFLFPFFTPKLRYRLARVWCISVITWLRLTCGVRYEIEGLANLPDSPCVIVSNHQSSWETLFFYSLVSPASPILKKELLRIPLWGWALKLLKPISIDRANKREAGKSLLTQGRARLKDGNWIILFPEGRRSPPQTVAKFSRSGAKLAISTNVPLLPIAHNAGDFWPKSRFIKTPGLIRVTIGVPIDTAEANASALTLECENWIRSQAIAQL
jgi:1-acyl-sn-glycerol-3-phosphate acyltransferase